MIELAAAAGAAALLNDAVAAVDKIYDWWRTRKGAGPASVRLEADPAQQALKYVRAGGGGEVVVLTYDALAGKLSPGDVAHIHSFEERMDHAIRQWEALNSGLRA